MDMDNIDKLGQSRKKQPVDIIKGLKSVGVICVISLSIYIVIAQGFNSRFLPNTYISDMDISYATVREAKSIINNEFKNYSIDIKTKNGKDYLISGKDISLSLLDEKELEAILAGQRSMQWGMKLFQKNKYSLSTSIDLDDTLLSYKLNNIFDENNNEKIERPILREIVKQAILSRNEYIDISTFSKSIAQVSSDEDADASIDESVDTSIDKTVELFNNCLKSNIEYRNGIEIDSALIGQWVQVDAQGQPVFNDEKIAEFVDMLSAEYNISDSAIDFITSYGETVRVPIENSDSRVDKAAEVEAIKAAIASGYVGERIPVGLAAEGVGKIVEIGDTYIEVNLTAQKLLFYKEGQKLVESDIVSGNETEGHPTEEGLYTVDFANRVEKSEETETSYVLPFADGLEIFGNQFRDVFGGDMYMHSGTYGDIEMPIDAARELYFALDSEVPLICYKLEPVQENTSTVAHTNKTKKKSKKKSRKRSTAGRGSQGNNTAAQNNNNTCSTETPKPTEEVSSESREINTETLDAKQKPNNPSIRTHSSFGFSQLHCLGSSYCMGCGSKTYPYSNRFTYFK